MLSSRATTALCTAERDDIVRRNAEGDPPSNGERQAVTLGPAAQERLLRA